MQGVWVYQFSVAWHRGPVEPISDYIKQRNIHLNTVQGVWVYQFSVAWHCVTGVLLNRFQIT